MSTPNLSIFDFENYPVRWIFIDGKPWFAAIDVLRAMKSSTKVTALKALIEEDLGVGYVTNTPLASDGGVQETIVIAKPALTVFVARSRTKLGKRLNRWIHTEVLPSIEEKGYYLSPAQKQRHNQARLQGKYSRRTLTDAIKAYVDRHPELSPKAKKWIYKNATDELYRQVYGQQAKKLVEAIGCDRRHLRESLSIDELCAIDGVELTAMHLIDTDVPPKDAMLQAAGRVMVVGAFRDRHALPSAS